MKYKIEKNTVQETLILPLYSRKLCKGDRQNVAQDCENQGCGRVFRGFRRGKGAFSMGQPFASIQQGLYAGVQRFERPFRQRLFPISR